MDLTKPKKEQKDPLTPIEKEVIKELNKKFHEKLEYTTKKVLKNVGEKIDRFFDKYEKQMLYEFKKSNKNIQNFCKQIDSIEETFLILYQNIKQNQFLYANYPEEWIKEINEKMNKALNE